MHKSGIFNSSIIAKLAIVLYFVAFSYIAIFGYYLLPYILLLVAFILILLFISELEFIKWFSDKPIIYKALFIFLFALLLRFFLLFQTQIITKDIVFYVDRTRWFMAGMIPYQDFDVNKPPLFLYLLRFIASILGPGEIQFRSFFSITDSMVSVLIFYLCLTKYNDSFSFKAAFSYAICPLPIIAIGLSGHYEPIVMVFVLLSLFFLIKNRYNSSSILLGVGFAFKFFPIVLLPFFAWKVKHWKERIIYFILFFIPFILSIIPIIAMGSTAFNKYLYHQTYSWAAKKSFAYIFEFLTGAEHIFTIKFSFFITAFFMVLLLIMFISWIRKRFNVTQWLKIIITLYLIYYGLVFITFIKYYQTGLNLSNYVSIMIIVGLIYFTIIIIVYIKYIRHLKINKSDKDELFILSSFSLIFLVLSSSQFNPWYILWFLPFVFAIENRKLRFILLLLILWNFEGMGIKLLKGLTLA